jgi:hypothetical protein
MSQEKILNVYLYGSHVYGTDDEESDVDHIFVVDTQRDKECQLFAGKYNVTSYPVSYFQHLINEHSVTALECFFLPHGCKIELHRFEFDLSLAKLRKSFSAKSSNSWVKAKKKIDVHSEYRLGRKSLFHSLRIIDFGIQIAEYGEIRDYRRINHSWEVIQQQGFTEWQRYKDYWQTVYNTLRSKFREVAPLEK